MYEIWLKPGPPVVSEVRILTQCKDIIDKDKKARKAKKRSKEKEQLICDEDWGSLFDVSGCKCPMPAIPHVRNGKLSCSCSWENRIPLEEIEFLKDQRTPRKMYMSSSLDKVYANKILNRLEHHPPSPMHVD